MTQNEIRVGIVGARAEKSWAKVSRVAGIKGLPGLGLAAMALVLLFAEPRVRAEVANAAPNLPDAPLANLPQTSAQTTDAPAPTGQSGSQTSPAPSKAPPPTPEEQRKKAQ